MKKNIKYYEIDYKMLDNYTDILNRQLDVYFQNQRELLGEIFWLTIIFTIVFIIIALPLTYIFKPTDTFLKMIGEYFVVGTPLIIFIIATIYQHNITKNNKGRTIIKIPIPSTQNNIDQKLKDMLFFFKFKEKRYHGEKVYFAKKQVIFKEPITTKTYYRYIKYTIKNNILEIEAWTKNGLPIDNNTFAIVTKTILLNELYTIKKCIINEN